ncbi:Rne/Rng family ribonuclease, partial [Actinomyces sp.]|uniref:Rne/Rng family ribonuclease n=1 Tax=Actinomyces sp. TaxID=29317 RepID=UPI0028A10286
MTNPDTSAAPESPVASLLFQAPAFQAPTFQEPEAPTRGSGRSSSHDEPDEDAPGPRRKRGGRTKADRAEAPETPRDEDEDAKPARKRRSRRKKDEDTGADNSGQDSSTTDSADQDDSASQDHTPDEESEAAPKKRSRRSSRAKARKDEDQSSSDTPADSAAHDGASVDEGTQGRSSGKSSGRHSGSDDSQDDSASRSHRDSGGDEEDQEGGTSRRRRRRRSRSSESRGSDSRGSEDPSDQVTALKGSTRLEAKKQRRREGRKEGRRRHVITESEFLARREAVDRQMVIRHHNGLDQVALLEDGLLVEHYVTRRTSASMVGNIYLGRVQNVLPSMEAAFIDVGRGRNAVLYAGEVNWDAVGLEGRPRRIEAALKSGDPVLVQVTKDPIGHKGARLTSQITLAGRYLVLIPNGSMMGISRKLPEKERMRLKKILKKAVPGGSGVIVRTAAEGATEQQLADDIARLSKQWADIEAKQKKTKSAPVLLRGEPELAVRVVRDVFNEDFNKLVIQGRETFDTVSEYVHDLSPELSDRVEQWVGTDDAFHAFRIDEQLAKGMDRKVWLPSGGTLIIDRTEAMTVIDVNTGKYIGAGGTLEETVTRNNLEAAEEIVRQLRLRDIGGIIIVDFVDMVLESNRDLVLRRLVECLGRDRTRHQVTEITSLGLVQMTRKRVGEGLVEAFSTPCEVCEGRGFIVHHEPVENTGSSDHTGGGHGSGRGKGRKSVEEPRRLDEGADRGRTREALSAIAAASGHASRSSDEGGPAVAPVASTHPEVIANTVAAESGAGADGQSGTGTSGGARSGAAGAESDDAPTTRTRGSRRRRAVKASSAEPGAALSHEVPEVEAEVAAAPVESLLVSAEEPEDVEESELVPVTRPKRRRVARSSGETAPAGAEAAGGWAGAAGEGGSAGSGSGSTVSAQTGSSSERVADELAEAPAESAAGSAAAKAPSRRRSGHRRVASSGTVDTGAAELPVPESGVAESVVAESGVAEAQAAGTAAATAVAPGAEKSGIRAAGAGGRKSRAGRSRATAASIELPQPKAAEVESPTHSVAEIELPSRTGSTVVEAPAAELPASKEPRIELPERPTDGGQSRPATRRPRR